MTGQPLSIGLLYKDLDMCGIFGVTGTSNGYRIVREGLLKLAYRGYDSAGIACPSTSGGALLQRTMGHPENLPDSGPSSSSAIGHTRWATHGEPSEENAHPHLSMDGGVFVVHNGIIENYLTLKEGLIEEGYSFYSETDTEVIPNLIEKHYKTCHNAKQAIESVLPLLEGSFSIVVMFLREPINLYVAKKGSPLLIGSTPDLTYYVSSDRGSFPKDTFQYADISEGVVLQLRPNCPIEGVRWKPFSSKTDDYELDGYNDFMAKEIASQGESLPKLMDSPILEEIKELFPNAGQIIITGCGSALYASQMVAPALEQKWGIPVRVISAGELQYDDCISTKGGALIAVSQSGETADTLRCVKRFERLPSIAIHNSNGSSLAHLCDFAGYIHAGKEISVASTKAVTHQAVALLSLAYDLSPYAKDLPLETIFSKYVHISALAHKLAEFKNIVVVARGNLVPSAYETALKIKEICYIHAEAMSASEFKHGPLALIDENMPTLAYVCKNTESKTASNIQEIKARGGLVFGVLDEKCSKETKSLFDQYVEIPCMDSFPHLNPILFTICGQLINYDIAIKLGVSVDRPRNLAKSVTTE